MTSYIAITDPETDPDAPLTSELAKKWRDNAIAIAEGDPTAVVNQAAWHPYDLTPLGNSGQSGVYYNFGVNGAATSVQTPVLQDGYEYRINFREIGHNNGVSTDIQVELRRQATGTYAGVGVLLSGVLNTTLVSGEIIFSTIRRNTRFHHVTGVLRGTLTGFGNAIQTATPINLMQELTAADQIDRIRIGLAAGSTDGGILQLERRKLYIG